MDATVPQPVFRTGSARLNVDGPLYGVAPETAIRTLGDVTRYHAERRPKCVASWFEGRRTSYAELNSRVNRIAQALLAKGLRKDDSIVYAGKNSDRYFELLFGCAKAGVVLVSVSWRLAAHDLAYIVRDCGAKLVFADESTAEAVAAIASEFTFVKLFVAMEQPVNGWPAFAAWYGAYPDEDPMVPVASSEAALQLYTSGATGRPKSTQLTHTNLTSAFFRPVASGEPWAQWSDDDVSLVLLPIAHISGTGGGFLCYCAGATNVVVRDFEPANVLRLIVELRVSRLVLVPAAIKLLLDHPDVDSAGFSRLHHILYGASPIPLDLPRAARRATASRLFFRRTAASAMIGHWARIERTTENGSETVVTVNRPTLGLTAMSGRVVGSRPTPEADIRAPNRVARSIGLVWAAGCLLATRQRMRMADLCSSLRAKSASDALANLKRRRHRLG